MNRAAVLHVGLMVLALGWGAPAWADQGAQVARWIELVGDDPRAMARTMTTQANGPPGAERAWAQLGLSMALQALEDHGGALAALNEAKAQRLSGDPVFDLFLELRTLGVAQLRDAPEDLIPKATDLQRRLDVAQQPIVACVGLEGLMWLQTESRELDQAWRSAEALERCARQLGLPTLEAKAVLQMGLLVLKSSPDERDGVAQLHRALGILAQRPARLLRANIAWELGHALEGTDVPSALAQYALSERLSREIQDDVGGAVAQLDAARQLNNRGLDEDRALFLALQARDTLVKTDSETRTAIAYEVIINILAKRKDPAVLSEIQAAKGWIKPSLSPRQHAYLLDAIALGYAAMGRHREAFEVQQQVTGMVQALGNSAVRSATLQMQARYDSARREAENAELRYREEANQLRLAAAQDRQFALLAMLAAAGMAAGLAIWLAWRAIRQRRALATLALRDELTGLPNRRALVEMAQLILGHCRRAQVPVAVGLIDLDHFKRVNDTYGHDVGDQVLKAFAKVLSGTVREQDAAGRWGGEEFLVVLPGTDEAGMRQHFERLRAGLAEAGVDGLQAPHGLSCSMGAIVDGSAAATLDVLAKRADEQLYRAKGEGRDRLCVTAA